MMTLEDTSELAIQPTYARLRWSVPHPGPIMGLGQEGKLTESTLTRAIRNFFEEKAIAFLVTGTVLTFGAKALEDTAFAPVMVTAGGVLIAFGLLPIILGIF